MIRRKLLNLDPAEPNHRAVWSLTCTILQDKGKMTPKAIQRSSGLPPQFQRESITSVTTSQAGAPGGTSRTNNSYLHSYREPGVREVVPTPVGPEGETAAPV